MELSQIHVYFQPNHVKDVVLCKKEMTIVTINNLPIELLEIIFKQLDLKDLGNCSQTCQLWESIISAIFMNKGKCQHLQMKLITINNDLL